MSYLETPREAMLQRKLDTAERRIQELQMQILNEHPKIGLLGTGTPVKPQDIGQVKMQLAAVWSVLPGVEGLRMEGRSYGEDKEFHCTYYVDELALLGAADMTNVLYELHKRVLEYLSKEYRA